MARRFPRTLIRLSSSVNLSKSSPISLSSRLLSHRTFHTQARSDPPSGAGVDVGEIGFLGFRTLEDAIQSTIARSSAPDWLPFLPGSSYWVPPRRKAEKKSFVDLVSQLANPLTEEESLALISSRGWPCSSVFFDGSVSEHPIPVEVEFQVHVQTSRRRNSSEDDD